MTINANTTNQVDDENCDCHFKSGVKNVQNKVPNGITNAVDTATYMAPWVCFINKILHIFDMQ